MNINSSFQLKIFIILEKILPVNLYTFSELEQVFTEIVIKYNRYRYGANKTWLSKGLFISWIYNEISASADEVSGGGKIFDKFSNHFLAISGDSKHFLFFFQKIPKKSTTQGQGFPHFFFTPNLIFL